MDNQWLDNLRHRMEAHTEPPPNGLWDDIEQVLDRPKKARRAMVWSTCAAAAVALLVFLIPWNRPENDRIVEVNMKEDAPAVNAPVVSETIPGIPQQPFLSSVIHQRRHEPITNPAPCVESSVTPVSEPTVDPPVLLEDLRAETSSETDPATSPETRPEQQTFDYRDYVEVSRPKKNRWQTGVFAANISSGNSSRQTTIVQSSFNWSSGLANNIENSGSFLEHNPVYTDVDHRLPVTVGLSVSYGLDERWSISGGVNYTMLSSRFQTAESTNRHSRQQVLHNIGIPVSISYNIWRTGGLSIYASAGGLVEKSVAGSTTYKHTSGGDVLSDQKKNLSDRVQFSINGSVGLQYDFAKQIGLYAEPGVNYYFDNKSGVETIYKAKPLNFGLRLGVRFSL